MIDPLYDDIIKTIKDLRNQVILKDIEIDTLRQNMSIKDKKPTHPHSKIKLIEDYNSLDWVKYYQTLYKKATGVALYIPNWSTATMSMKRVVDAFQAENYGTEEIKQFLEWAVLQKTHTGEYVPVGYLFCMIQQFWHELPKELPHLTVSEKIKETLKRTIGR